MRNILLRMAAVLMLLAPAAAIAGPAEDANAVVDRWMAAISAGNKDAVVELYAPNAVLLGTASPIISEGTDAIRSYFDPLKPGAIKGVMGDRRTIVLGEDAVATTGFYDFSVMRDGTPQQLPARFTMVVAKRDGRWLIVHHHSSPRAQPK
jgi:uncharacterized protein (TIGR02246 family)